MNSVQWREMFWAKNFGRGGIKNYIRYPVAASHTLGPAPNANAKNFTRGTFMIFAKIRLFHVNHSHLQTLGSDAFVPFVVGVVGSVVEAIAQDEAVAVLDALVRRQGVGHAASFHYRAGPYTGG